MWFGTPVLVSAPGHGWFGGRHRGLEIQLGIYCSSLTDTLILGLGTSSLTIEYHVHTVPYPRHSLNHLLYLQFETRTKSSPELSHRHTKITLISSRVHTTPQICPHSKHHPAPSGQVKHRILTFYLGRLRLAAPPNTHPYFTSPIHNIYTMAPKKFPKFEKLPLEIRRHIWKLSHAPRIIRAKCENATTPKDHRTIW